MKFDTIIIGGGLCGLTAGIALSRQGRKCMIVSAGQSALHFFSGSFELYNGEHPLEKIEALTETHPYSKIGKENVACLAAEVKGFFADAGIKLKGETETNHSRVTPLGAVKDAWLTLEEYVTLPRAAKKIALVNLEGYLDFQTSFVARLLDISGLECQLSTVSLSELESLRKNPTEMRATHIAKALSGEAMDVLAEKLNTISDEVDEIWMPAVVGLDSDRDVESLRSKVNKPLYFIATLPPSTPGIRVQLLLKKYFQSLGGTYLLGDSVTGGEFKDGRLLSVSTANHGEAAFTADSYVLATGSFFSRGLEATQDKVIEKTFGLDVDYVEDRAGWYEENVFTAQPYMNFGVRTDKELHPYKDGIRVENIWAAGSVLSGCNAVKEGCGAGVALLSALRVSELIAAKEE